MIRLRNLIKEVLENGKVMCDCGHNWDISDGGKDKYLCHKCGNDNTPNKEFIDFAKKRLEGATKIVNNAKEKGGYAMLTYHHFVVKLPYYEKASKGEFNCEMAKVELRNFTYIFSNLDEDVEIDQTEFQKLVGLIEVLGELIIKSRETK